MVPDEMKTLKAMKDYKLIRLIASILMALLWLSICKLLRERRHKPTYVSMCLSSKPHLYLSNTDLTGSYLSFTNKGPRRCEYDDGKANPCDPATGKKVRIRKLKPGSDLECPLELRKEMPCKASKGICLISLIPEHDSMLASVDIRERAPKTHGHFFSSLARTHTHTYIPNDSGEVDACILEPREGPWSNCHND